MKKQITNLRALMQGFDMDMFKSVEYNHHFTMISSYESRVLDAFIELNGFEKDDKYIGDSAKFVLKNEVFDIILLVHKNN